MNRSSDSLEFDRLAESIVALARGNIVMEPKVVDTSTPLECRKMYLRCPTGYLIELKGYRTSVEEGGMKR